MSLSWRLPAGLRWQRRCGRDEMVVVCARAPFNQGMPPWRAWIKCGFGRFDVAGRIAQYDGGKEGEREIRN